MNLLEKSKIRGHIIFDHDGTLINTDDFPYQIYHGIANLLFHLKNEGFMLYVWTARSHKSTEESLKSFKIDSFFTKIYGHDDGVPKPHPKGLETLTAGIEKNNILHIGDSMGDISGAQNYGIEVIAACWNNPEEVERFKEIANYVAVDVNQCLEMIKRKFYV